MKNKEEKSRLFFYLFYAADFWQIKASDLADFKHVIIAAIPILVWTIQSSNFGLKCLFLAVFKRFGRLFSCSFFFFNSSIHFSFSFLISSFSVYSELSFECISNSVILNIRYIEPII